MFYMYFLKKVSVGILMLVMIMPISAFAYTDASGKVSEYKQVKNGKVSAKAWKFAQQYKNGTRMKNKGQYNAFAREIYKESGLRIIPWSRYFTKGNKSLNRIRRVKGAGIRKELAVKISAVYGVMQDVYKD